MSAELGLSVAERPSTPCMATRLPYGAKLDTDVLQRLERGEAWMRDQGFAQVRLRFHEPILRIEVLPEDFDKMFMKASEVTSYLKGLVFIYITLQNFILLKMMCYLLILTKQKEFLI